MFADNKLALDIFLQELMSNELVDDGTVGSDRRYHDISSLDGGQIFRNHHHRDVHAEAMDALVALVGNPVCEAVLDDNLDGAAALVGNPVCEAVLDDNRDDAAALVGNPVCEAVPVDDHALHHHE